jgi:azurin
MDSHHSAAHDAETGGSWNLVYKLCGAGFGLFALVASLTMIISGIRDARRIPQPAAPSTASAAAAPAAAPGAPAPAGAPAAAPAAAPASATVSADGELVIKPDPANPLAYDIKAFTVKAGQKLKITFNNQSSLPQPHNLILGKIGSKDRLLAAINALMVDPNGMAKGYVPDSPDIIAHTKLLNPGQTETIEFTVPAEKGDYPYVCGFPGHALIMNGVMKAE